MATSPFAAGGIASGLDTNTLINELVKIEQAPLNALRNQQAQLKQQVSQLGSLASSLSGLNSAATALGSGVVANQVLSTNTAFSATASTSASQGSFTVSVQALAYAAKARSQGYTDPNSGVIGGTLTLGVQGTNYSINVGDNAGLNDIASSINSSGAPVTASVVSDGSKYYLSVTNNTTGVASGVLPANALTFGFASTGSTGTQPAFSSVQTAANAQVTVDGLQVSSQTNAVTGVVPGVTLNLKSLSAANTTEQLQIGSDSSGTAQNLQKFVDAYNAIASQVEQHLNVQASTDTSVTLGGDPTLRSLQQQLQSLLTTSVPGISGGKVSTLADLGLTTSIDGTLSLDQSQLQNALAQNPAAVNQLFSQAGTGIKALVQNVTTLFTDPVNGALTARQQGLNSEVNNLDDEANQESARLDAYRASLVQEFTATESIISQLKAASGYLGNYAASGAVSSSSSTSGGG